MVRNGRKEMLEIVHHGPTVGAQALRALARYPERIAFVSDGKHVSYRATLDLIGRMQGVFAHRGWVGVIGSRSLRPTARNPGALVSPRNPWPSAQRGCIRWARSMTRSTK
jgi:hypothetical protein